MVCATSTILALSSEGVSGDPCGVLISGEDSDCELAAVDETESSVSFRLGFVDAEDAESCVPFRLDAGGGGGGARFGHAGDVSPVDSVGVGRVASDTLDVVVETVVSEAFEDNVSRVAFLGRICSSTAISLGSVVFLSLDAGPSGSVMPEFALPSVTDADTKPRIFAAFAPLIRIRFGIV